MHDKYFIFDMLFKQKTKEIGSVLYMWSAKLIAHRLIFE